MRMLVLALLTLGGSLLTLGAGSALAQADPCGGLRGFDYHHCSTALQADLMVGDHWGRLTPRERELTRVANAAVDEFYRAHGRLPNARDRRWGRGVAERAGVRSRAEAEFLTEAMNSRLRATREMARIESDLCAGARRYAAMGFGHLYRDVMPECF